MILSTPEVYAELDEITDNEFVYHVHYYLDIQQAIRSNVSLVKIQLTQNTKARLTIGADTSYSTLDRRTLLENILMQSAMATEASKRASRNVLFEQNSDFTTRISNDRTNELVGTTEVKTTVRSFKPVSLGELDDAQINQPILESKLEAPKVLLGSSNLQTISEEVLKSGREPASFIIRDKIIQTAKTNMGGLSIPFTEVRTYPIVASLPLTVAKPTSKNLVTIQPVLETTNNVLVFERLRVPKTVLSNISEFWISFLALDSDGIKVESIKLLVEHSRNVGNLTTPRFPPTLALASYGGKSFLQITQNDMYALGVDLYKKRHDIKAPTAKFEFVGRIPVTTKNSPRKITESSGNYVYRAIPYGSNGSIASEFGTATSLNKTAISNETTKVVSVIATPEAGRITVKLGNLPSDVLVVFLKRLDNGTKQIIDVGNAFVKDYNEFEFIDNTVISDRNYTYYADLMSKNGCVYRCNGEATLLYKEKQNNVVSSEIRNVAIIKNGNTLDVTFRIETTFSTNEESLIKSALEQQNLILYFQNDISKTKLQSLSSYVIERVCLTTGVVESFGVTNNQNFSDRTLGSLVGVSPIQPGCDYKYIVNTYLRSTTTTLEDFVQEVKDEQYPAKNYTFSPWKWRHPITLTHGNLVDSNSLLANYGYSAMTFGNVADTVETVAMFSDVTPNVTDTRCVRINSRLARIQWKVNGLLEKIDHFILLQDCLGARNIVGKCHNISSSGVFEFLDDTTDSSGELYYVIIPVFFDYTRGQEVNTNTIIV